MEKTSRGTARVRVEGIRRTAKRGDYYLSQSPGRFAMAVRALGGNEIKFDDKIKHAQGSPARVVMW
jgi:hypothetical protein